MHTFLIACGGTGGHLAPGIALAERLTGRGHKVRLIVSRKEVDSRLCRKYGHFDFVRTPGAAFSLHPVKLAKFCVGLLGAMYYSWKLLKETRPHAVVAFGGFTAVGLVLVATMSRVPVVLHEANRKPGKAIRALAALATRLYLPPGVTTRNAAPGSVNHPGYPLRKEIKRVNREQARAALGIDTHGKVLVVLGGSQGAASLNEWVSSHVEVLCAEGVNVYCITGIGKGTEGVMEFHSALGTTTKAWFTPFSDRMTEVLSAADLVISRAGAGSIAEMVQCRAPCILMPYPFAADNHQIENARFMEQQGAAVVVEQTRIQFLLQEVRDLIFNDWMLDRIRENMRSMSMIDAAEWIAHDLETLAKEQDGAQSVRHGQTPPPFPFKTA